MNIQVCRIYLTYCAREKDDSYKGTGEKVFPDQLHISDRTQKFIAHCKDSGVYWAILSDKHRVWFSHVKHKWYDKAPDSVTLDVGLKLLRNFNKKLATYSKIFFYYPREKQCLEWPYNRLLKETKLVSRVEIFKDLSDIVH